MTKYRKGVGALIINDNKEIFVGQRNDIKSAWQMPQGGVDDNDESLESAVLREVYEETGILSNKLKVLAFTDTLKYEFPEHKAKKLWNGIYIGQEQVWFAMKFLGTKSDINIEDTHPKEFIDYKWVHVEELINLVVDFKQSLYNNVVEHFKQLGII